MEETLEFCQRVLGAGATAAEAAREALDRAPSERVALLRAASHACRSKTAATQDGSPEPGPAALGLGAAVARELAIATARLPERQREALALRERCALSYEELSEVMGIGAPTAGALLARSRLRLRDELRGAAVRTAPGCDQRDRALRALARRQDREVLAESEGQWLDDHVASCAGCAQAHAAMLEASVCYRAWTVEAGPVVSELEALAQAPVEAYGPAELEGEVPGSSPLAGASSRPGKPPLWSRFRAALAADARR